MGNCLVAPPKERRPGAFDALNDYTLLDEVFSSFTMIELGRMRCVCRRFRALVDEVFKELFQMGRLIMKPNLMRYSMCTIKWLQMDITVVLDGIFLWLALKQDNAYYTLTYRGEGKGFSGLYHHAYFVCADESGCLPIASLLGIGLTWSLDLRKQPWPLDSYMPRGMTYAITPLPSEVRRFFKFVDVVLSPGCKEDDSYVIVYNGRYAWDPE